MITPAQTTSLRKDSRSRQNITPPYSWRQALNYFLAFSKIRLNNVRPDNQLIRVNCLLTDQVAITVPYLNTVAYPVTLPNQVVVLVSDFGPVPASCPDFYEVSTSVTDSFVR